MLLLVMLKMNIRDVSEIVDNEKNTCFIIFHPSLCLVVDVFTRLFPFTENFKRGFNNNRDCLYSDMSCNRIETRCKVAYNANCISNNKLHRNLCDSFAFITKEAWFSSVFKIFI